MTVVLEFSPYRVAKYVEWDITAQPKD